MAVEVVMLVPVLLLVMLLVVAMGRYVSAQGAVAAAARDAVRSASSSGTPWPRGGRAHDGCCASCRPVVRASDPRGRVRGRGDDQRAAGLPGLLGLARADRPLRHGCGLRHRVGAAGRVPQDVPVRAALAAGCPGGAETTRGRSRPSSWS